MCCDLNNCTCKSSGQAQVIRLPFFVDSMLPKHCWKSISHKSQLRWCSQATQRFHCLGGACGLVNQFDLVIDIEFLATLMHMHVLSYIDTDAITINIATPHKNKLENGKRQYYGNGTCQNLRISKPRLQLLQIHESLFSPDHL